MQELGRSPTVAELAVATGATEESVIEAIEAGQGYRATSIDAAVSDDDPLSARLGDFDTRFESVEERALLAPALAKLAPREQAILRMRFVEGLTQSEIALTIGVSQMHVSQFPGRQPRAAAGAASAARTASSDAILRPLTHLPVVKRGRFRSRRSLDSGSAVAGIGDTQGLNSDPTPKIGGLNGNDEAILTPVG